MPDWLLQSGLMIASGLVGWFGRRRFTREREREEAASLMEAIELRERLEAKGWSLDETKAFRDQLVQGRMQITPEISAILTGDIPDEPEVTDDTYDFGNTTAAMIAGMSARLAEIEGKLDDELSELAEHSTSGRVSALKEAQASWQNYRDLDAEFAAQLFEGGTGAPVMRLARQLQLTEGRLAEVSLAKAEEQQLTGGA